MLAEEVLLVWLAVSAFASDCPWPAIETVSSTMTTVTINGEQRSVKGRTNWSSLALEFRECDLNAAANALEHWRAQRRATNWSAGIGISFLWPALIATPFTAGAASRWRFEMEQQLRS